MGSHHRVSSLDASFRPELSVDPHLRKLRGIARTMSMDAHLQIDVPEPTDEINPDRTSGGLYGADWSERSYERGYGRELERGVESRAYAYKGDSYGYNRERERDLSRFVASTNVDDFATIDLNKEEAPPEELPRMDTIDERRMRPEATGLPGRLARTRSVDPSTVKVREFTLQAAPIGSSGFKDALADVEPLVRQSNRLARSNSMAAPGTGSRSLIPRGGSFGSSQSAVTPTHFPHSSTQTFAPSSSRHSDAEIGSDLYAQTPARIPGQATELLDLTDECLVALLLQVRAVKDWLNCTRVCRRFARLANEGLSVLRFTNSAAYTGRGGIAPLLTRFPNLRHLEVPTTFCTNALCAALDTSCRRLRTLVLVAGPPSSRLPSSKPEPQVLPPALGTLVSLLELRVLSEQVTGFPGSMGLLSSLETLELDGCRRVKNLPESLGELKALKNLTLIEAKGLTSLPESLGLLAKLKSLKLYSCSGLSSIPASVGKMSSLEALEITNCEKLKRLPVEICQLAQLRSLRLTGFKELERLDFGEDDEEELTSGGWALPPDNPFPHLRVLELGWSEGPVPVHFGATTTLHSLTASCPHLTELPDWFRHLGVLRHLELRMCRDLRSLPSSCLELRRLQVVKLLNCPSLQTLPENMGRWASLERLELSKCVQLMEIPSSVGQLRKLESLVIKDAHQLALLPDSLGSLSSLEILQLLNCPKLASLPTSFKWLTSLQVLEIWRCSSLIELPRNFGQLASLQKLRIINCKSLECLPNDFGQLKSLSLLEVVDCGLLTNLPEGFGQLAALDTLTLRLRALEELPYSCGRLTSLKSLVLAGVSALTFLPTTFGQLTSLKALEIESGDLLLKLPDSFGKLKSLEFLRIQWCDALQLLPEGLGQLTALTALEIMDCRRLGYVPLSMGGMIRLQSLRIKDCPSLNSFPPSFGQMRNLISISVRGTPLNWLPPSFGQLSALETLSIHSAQISTLPDSFGNLISLRSMRLEHCPKLASLPSSIGALGSLETLKLQALPSLGELPVSFGHLGQLRELEIMDTGLTSLECLGEIRTLQKLEIKGCDKLPESWGHMGRWMQKMSGTRMTITFSPPPNPGGKGKVKPVTQAEGEPQCKVM